MRRERPSITAGWIAAHRLKLDAARPLREGGHVEEERRLYASISRLFVLPGLRPTGMAVRTQFIDGEVMRALREHTTQFVLVGAGYDGRAFRFGGAGIHWIEVDHPATQTKKRRLIDELALPTPGISFASLDLVTGNLDVVLEAAGHRHDAPALFICEGLFSYLPIEVTHSVVRTLRAKAAPGSALVATFLVEPEGGGLARMLTGSVDQVLSAIGEARQSRYRPNDPQRLFEAGGWEIVRSASSQPHRVNAGSHLLAISAKVP